MSTFLLDPPVDSASPNVSPSPTAESFGKELQRCMAAVELKFRRFNISRSATSRQKQKAAETFSAEKEFVSMGKKLFDTKHHSWRRIVRVLGQIEKYWLSISLPYPERGIRLIRRADLQTFSAKMLELKEELHKAEQNLEVYYNELKTKARAKLGTLYHPDDYPETLIGMFTVDWEFANLDAPEYLHLISPNLYRREAARIRDRFNEAVVMAEQAFTEELTKMVNHLIERLSGTDDGKPKQFRDSVVTNLTDFFARFKNLNIGSSLELEQVVDDVKQIVSGVTPEALRNDGTLRGHVTTSLTAVQSTLDTLMVDRPRRNLIRRSAA